MSESAPPARTFPAPSTETPSLPLAGLTRRLMSLAYEGLLLAALLFVANFILLPLVSPLPGSGGRLVVPDTATRALLLCALVAIAGLYFIWSWTGGRRTLPMKTWRMRIVDEGGSSLEYKGALVRYVAAWIGPGLALVAYALLRPEGLGGVAVIPLALNYLAAFVDPDRQFLHDRIAGTRIVSDS